MGAELLAMADLVLALDAWPACNPPLVTCGVIGDAITWVVVPCDCCGEPAYHTMLDDDEPAAGHA